jgi:serine/threonine protein kinase
MEDIQSCEEIKAKFGSLPSSFQQLRIIGRGASGLVVRARESITDREVAIKILFSLESDTGLERFMREARVLASLNHPNIVKIFKSGVSEKGNPFHVMEWIDGVSLADELQKSQILPDNIFFESFRQLASALEYAHQHNVVHRDIKPSNIMLCNDSEMLCSAKLVDFGIARQVSETAGAGITKSGVLVGTPIYMSPEQCSGASQQAGSDIYSLACVMYQCLSGKVPFEGDNSMEVMYKHLHEKPPLLELSGHGKRLSRLVYSCMEKNPDERPGAGRLLSELSEIQATSSVRIERKPASGKLGLTDTRVKLALSVAVGCGLLAATAALVANSRLHVPSQSLAAKVTDRALARKERERMTRLDDLKQRIKQSESHFLPAKTVEERLKYGAEICDLLDEKGHVLSDMAGECLQPDPVQSERLRLQAEADFRQIVELGPQFDRFDEKSVRRARALIGLASTEDARCRSDRALDYFKQALIVAQKGEKQLLESDILMARSHTYVNLSLFKNADLDVSMAIALWKECSLASAPSLPAIKGRELASKKYEGDVLERAISEARSLTTLCGSTHYNDAQRCHFLGMMMPICKFLVDYRSTYTLEAANCLDTACRQISNASLETVRLRRRAYELATDCAAAAGDKAMANEFRQVALACKKLEP